ncbi:unnamed protein product [Victoria cruziana]
MYKSKLQEYCQRNSWRLPKYTVTQGGQDHNPKFKASVLVNGVNYEIQGFHRTSKDAQNGAARVAFMSLVDAARPSSDDEGASAAESSDPFHSGPNDDILKISYAEVGTGEDVSRLEEKIEAMASEEVQLNYKGYLQELVQGKRWSPPVYSQVREGPPHAPRFQAAVTVEGNSFESPSFFGTVREAEHDAAKVALASLHEGIQEEKPLSFKNMLRDYSQKRNLHLPTYTTDISGACHLPTFKSAVEIDGEVYTGNPATTKKEAEANAAKVAWFALKERGPKTSSSSRSQLGTASNVPALSIPYDERRYKPEASSSDDIEAKGSLVSKNRESKLSLEYRPQVAADSTWNPASDKQKHKTSLTSNREAEESTIFTSGKQPAVSDIVDKDESLLVPEEESTISSEFAADIYGYLDEQFIAGSAVLAGNITAPKLQKKVVVFPRLGNMKLPTGRVQVQFCDVKWVAVTGTDSAPGAK